MSIYIKWTLYNLEEDYERLIVENKLLKEKIQNLEIQAERNEKEISDLINHLKCYQLLFKNGE